jgi:hypothetical protein
MRVKFEAFSDTRVALTDAVRLASSTFCPAVFPVIAWQPASDSTNSAIAKLFNTLLILNTPSLKKSKPYFRVRLTAKIDNRVNS